MASRKIEVDDSVPPATALRTTPGVAATRDRSGRDAPLDTLDDWQRQFAAFVRTSDVAITATGVAVFIALAKPNNPDAHVAHVVSGLAAGTLLLFGLWATRAWEPRILGAGTAELKRLSHAVLGGGVLLALVGLAFTVISVRVWVLVAIPMIGMTCSLARFGLRKWLHRRRRQGRCVLSVLVVGGYDDVTDLVVRTRRDPHFGWVVTGACTPSGKGPDQTDSVLGVPVVGDLDDVVSLLRVGDYRVVAVAPTPGWGSARLHRLAWQLEDTIVELAVHPGLMEIAGPRLHIAPVDGMPLLRLTEPRLTGFPRFLKNVVDRAVALLLLALLSPLLLTIAVAVRLDGGPAFYFQDRVGTGGRLFRMVKFRSMIVEADSKIAELAPTNNGSGPLFKMHRDPRVTRVGRMIRRYSLDELPQILNVLTGSMSLVGPRPPLPTEVETYGADAQRRLLVRPGITGLWQVSGRSDLSWEESVRLDLRYVENWSLALDATILWKTFGAVLWGRGAY